MRLPLPFEKVGKGSALPDAPPFQRQQFHRPRLGARSKPLRFNDSSSLGACVVSAITVH